MDSVSGRPKKCAQCSRYKFRAIGASSTGLRYSFAVRTVGDWNQLPAVVVQQENPAAFKAQLARCAPVRIRGALKFG